jgi:methylenetetrahydrofolate reductase (NADH)
LGATEQKNGRGKLLVVGGGEPLADVIGKAVGENFEVVTADDAADGLMRARKEIPDIIVLGCLEPPGATYDLHNKLRGGWITKNIPLVVVDVKTPENPRSALSMEEGMQIEADDYLSLSSADTATSAAKLAEPIGRLKEKLEGRIKESANRLRSALLDPARFAITWEQVPGRGAFEISQEEIIDGSLVAAKGGLVDAISVTDNPGGNPAINTELLGYEIKKAGVEPLIHIACRDKNRNQVESQLFSMAAGGIRNVLVLTGDFPSDLGFGGRSRPVFDVDPIHILQLIGLMNAGMEYEAFGRKKQLAPTDFFAGVAVSPFKQLESELEGQYYKLRKKIEAGADFIIPQIGYDARKLHELLLWLKVNAFNTPVIANIYVLPLGAARLMNKNGIPGCVVTDKIVAEIAAEVKAEDKGKAARMERAAKMYAIARGMGCAGAHVGGMNITHKMVGDIAARGEELLKDWSLLVKEFDYPQTDGVYYFQKDEATGLNLETREGHHLKPHAPFKFWLGYLAHHAVFEPRSLLFKMLLPMARAIDKTGLLKRVFGWNEHQAKVALFGCLNCGDCGLFDVAYQCPMSQCPKNQRNGPCGGSYHGWCEVYPDEKKCIWVKAYERLRVLKHEDEIAENMVPPVDWALWETSSWLNFYNGRDHSARRLGIKKPGQKTESDTAAK